MHIDHVRPLASERLAHGPDTRRTIYSGNESPYFPRQRLTGSGRGHAQLRHLMPHPPEHHSHLINHSLLTGVLAIVIVYEKDFHKYAYLYLSEDIELHFISDSIFAEHIRCRLFFIFVSGQFHHCSFNICLLIGGG